MSAARPLAAWAQALAMFPEDVAETLTPWVRQLTSALGPLGREDAPARGAPDGFDGITRRGSYERLLLSEWLLADALPDEFLRRAASHEHAFLALAERTRARPRESVVLLDAGPWQLGAPRLAHLALLIAFARRAARARARFSWGVAQAAGGPLFESIDESSVPALLAARTVAEVTPGMLDAWHDRLGGGEPADLWIVGAAGLSRALSASRARGGSLVAVDEDDAALSVTLREGPRARAVELALPDQQLVARMLRDPFEATRTRAIVRAGHALASSDAIVSGCGRKLLARWRRGLCTMPIPNAPTATPGRVRRHGLPFAVVAAGVHRGRFVILMIHEPTRTLRLGQVGGPSASVGHFTEEPRVRAPWKPSPEAPLARLHLITTPSGRFRAFYVDERACLFELSTSPRAAHLIASDVAAVTSGSRRLAVVARRFHASGLPDPPAGPALIRLEGDTWGAAEPLGSPFAAARLAWLASSGTTKLASAIRAPSGEWHLHGTGRANTLTLAPDVEVVGLRAAPDGRAGVVCVDSDRSSLHLLGAGAASGLVYAAPADIERATLSDDGEVAVLCLASGEVHAVSVWRKQLTAVLETRGTR